MWSIKPERRKKSDKELRKDERQAKKGTNETQGEISKSEITLITMGTQIPNTL